MTHPETALVPYVRGELAGAERESVARHLEQCATCRESLAGIREVLDRLASERLEPPAIDWRRYRAELRGKVEERSARWTFWSLPRLVPVAAAGAIAGLALVIALHGVLRKAGDDVPIFDQTAIGSHLELLQDYAVVEKLDLLEDLEIVQNLDELSDTAGPGDTGGTTEG